MNRTTLPPLRSLRALLLLAVVWLWPAPADATTVKIFVMTGQSNMEGKGAVTHLEKLVKDDPQTFGHLQKDGAWIQRDDVRITYGGRIGPLTTGYGGRSHQIGPELGFGWAVGEAIKEPVLIVKVAKGGASLNESFRPPGAGGTVGTKYTELVEAVNQVRANIGNYFPGATQCEMVGLVWFQGWNDMINNEARANYKDNLCHFIRDLRKAWDAPGLLFVIGQMGHGGENPNGKNKAMRDAQAAPAQMDQFKGTVASTPTAPYWDDSVSHDGGYHYHGSAKFFYLAGEAFGKSMLDLMKVSSKAGGSVDQADQPPLPEGIDPNALPPRLRPVYNALTLRRYTGAWRILEQHKKTYERLAGNERTNTESLQAEQKIAQALTQFIETQVDAAVERLKAFESPANPYRLQQTLLEQNRSYLGIPGYDQSVQPIQKTLRTPEQRLQISKGQQFYRYLDNALRVRNELAIKPLAEFAERHKDTAYGKAAAAVETLKKDPKAELNGDDLVAATKS